jgi:DnaJ domain
MHLASRPSKPANRGHLMEICPMFERTKVDNSRDLAAAAASIELSDGRRVSGRFLISRSKTLIDILNGTTQFIEFEPFDGEAEIIAKSSIRSLRMISVPGGREPSTFIRDNGNFNPYDILGIKKGAGRSEVRAAFHKYAKSYHPDRYSNAELPQEVMSYLETMARRVNAAYEVLSEETARSEAFAAQRTEPVYQSSRPAV